MELLLQDFQRLFRNKKKLLFQVLNLAMVVLSALMIWKGLMTITKSASPVVVVLSGSMEPGFYRGDILWLDNNSPRYYIGDILVFSSKHRDVPIVHRIITTHERQNDIQIEYLTRGDNNTVDDVQLYPEGRYFLRPEDTLGKVNGVLRTVGYVTILFNDYPIIKYVMIGLMGIFVLTGNEQ